MFPSPVREGFRLLLFAGLLSATGHRGLSAQAPLQDSAVRTQVSGGDVEAMRRSLQKSIRDFQDKWRKAWRSAEQKRHNPIDLPAIRGWAVGGNGIIDEKDRWQGDRDAKNWTPDLRRYESMLCYIGSPSDRAIEAAKARSHLNIGSPITRQQITDAVNAPRDAVDRTRANGGAVVGTSIMTSFIASHLIRTSPDLGAVCPAWGPPDLPVQLDEGEAIDLALPPGNREPVRKERELLIHQLEAAHAQFPGDDWIAGQHLRFVYDQRSPGRTLAAAKACAGTVVVCSGLYAMAEEQAGHYSAAESAYRVVDSLTIPTTPDKDGLCIESETLLLLKSADRARITGADCREQRSLVERMWWLADPLWSVAGNERYVAHHSRRLHASLRAIDDRDERYIWARQGGGEAMRELVVRYGWPGYTYWPGIKFEDEINAYLENVTTRSVYYPHTAVEYSNDRTALIPAMDAILNPFDLNASHWNLNLPEGTNQDEWWPQEHMMLFTKLYPLPTGQEARWRRDSTILFQIVVDDPLRNLDTAATGASLATLSGGTSAADTRTLASAAVGEGSTLRLSTMLSGAPIVLSAEILPRSLREHAMRLRYGVRPPPTLRDMKAGEVAMSDPVFLRMPNHDIVAPSDIESVLRSMSGSLTFARVEPLAVYWESYGVPPGDSVHVRLRVKRNDDVNALRRLGSAIGVASGLRDSLTVEWTEPDARHGTVIVAGAKPVVGRSVSLDMHALPAGNYIVMIEMQRGAAAPVRSERQFTLREQ